MCGVRVRGACAVASSTAERARKETDAKKRKFGNRANFPRRRHRMRANRWAHVVLFAAAARRRRPRCAPARALVGRAAPRRTCRCRYRRWARTWPASRGPRSSQMAVRRLCARTRPVDGRGRADDDSVGLTARCRGAARVVEGVGDHESADPARLARSSVGRRMEKNPLQISAPIRRVHTQS